MNRPVSRKPDHLEAIKAILTDHVSGVEVRTFVSGVTWNANDYRDLNLVVIGDGKLDRRMHCGLKETIEDSNRPMQVNVLDWHYKSQILRPEMKGA